MCPEPKNNYRLHISINGAYFNSKSCPRDKTTNFREAMPWNRRYNAIYHPKDLKVKVRKDLTARP